MIPFQGWAKFRSALILFYSLAMLATVLPRFSAIPHTLILPYYLLVPGYAFALVLRQAEGVTQTFFFSLVWSVVIVTSVYSFLTLAPPGLNGVPLGGVIPAVTMVLTAYGYYHGR